MEEERSTVYKLAFNLNLVAEMKAAFNRLYDEVSEQFSSLTLEEKRMLQVLLVPEYIMDDLSSGLGEFWAESADSYEPIDLTNL